MDLSRDEHSSGCKPTSTRHLDIHCTQYDQTHLQVIDAGAMPDFVTALRNTQADTHKAAAWGILHMAMHGAAIADCLAEAGVLRPLIEAYCISERKSDAREVTKAAANEVIKQCTICAPLLAIMRKGIPEGIVTSAMTKAYAIMQGSVSGRREFVTSGALMRIQDLDQNLSVKASECVKALNDLFPKDLVSYYRQSQELQAQI
jgi:hypothetical protein